MDIPLVYRLYCQVHSRVAKYGRDKRCKTFLLMLDPNKSKDRIVRELDRLESEPYEYHDRVYKGYEKIAEENPDRVVRIDGEKSIECIAEVIIEEVRKII